MRNRRCHRQRRYANAEAKRQVALPIAIGVQKVLNENTLQGLQKGN